MDVERDSDASTSESESEDEATAQQQESNANGWQPPPGYKLVDSAEAGALDWDAIHNDPDIELWLIKAPPTIKLKNLLNAELEDNGDDNAPLQAKFKARKVEYQLSEEAKGKEPAKSENLDLYLPRGSSSNKLVKCKRKFARHLNVRQSMPVPVPIEEENAATNAVPGKRHPQPPNVQRTIDRNAVLRESLPAALGKRKIADEPVKSPSKKRARQ